VTFGPPIKISPRGMGESLVEYPPSGQSISWAKKSSVYVCKYSL